MKWFFIFFIAFALLAVGVPTGNRNAESLFTGKCYAADNEKSAVVADDNNDEDELLWPFGPPPEDEEEIIPEEQPGNEEEGNDEEGNQEEPQPGEENGENSGSDDEQLTPNQTPPDINTLPQKLPEPIDWSSIPGVKVPFFFLIDEGYLQGDSSEEPEIAHLKALKFADQILNGISFTIEPGSEEVYLADNISEIPENIYMENKQVFQGVIRFTYEVAVPAEKSPEAKKYDRCIVVSAQVPDSSIAASFEATLKAVFIEAVKTAYSREKKVRTWKTGEEIKGNITNWEVLTEGWLEEEQSFFLELRVWVKFFSTEIPASIQVEQ